MSAFEKTPLEKYSKLLWQCSNLVHEALQDDCLETKKVLIKQMLEINKTALASLWKDLVDELDAPFKEKEVLAEKKCE